MIINIDVYCVCLTIYVTATKINEIFKYKLIKANLNIEPA